MATETELAWAAGIVDGEGCISISVTNPHGQSISPTYKLSLTVSMTNFKTIERLHEIFGVGCLYEYEPSPKMGRMRSKRIVVLGRRVCDVLRLIRPYMVTKAYYADVAMEFDAIPNTYDCLRGVLPETLALKEQLRLKMRVGKPASGRRRQNEPVCKREPLIKSQA